MVELVTYKLNVNYSFPQLVCQAKKTKTYQDMSRLIEILTVQI